MERMANWTAPGATRASSTRSRATRRRRTPRCADCGRMG